MDRLKIGEIVDEEDKPPSGDNRVHSDTGGISALVIKDRLLFREWGVDWLGVVLSLRGINHGGCGTLLVDIL